MEKSPIRPENPKLKRQKEIRLKRNITEPRITRRSLSIRLNSKSQDNSPSNVSLHSCQNLSDALKPRHPIVPEAVILDQVQNVSRALEEVDASPPRRSLRPKSKVNYFRLHHGEDPEKEY